MLNKLHCIHSIVNATQDMITIQWLFEVLPLLKLRQIAVTAFENRHYMF